MNWKYIKPLKSASDVKDFEVKYSFDFPDDFKKTVAEFNGARPEYNVYDTDKTKERTIKSLLSFNRDDNATIWKTAEYNAKELDGKYIAFAIDEFGDLICFSIGDKSVVFLNMETLEAEPVARDFSSFLDKLYTIE